MIQTRLNQPSFQWNHRPPAVPAWERFSIMRTANVPCSCSSCPPWCIPENPFAVRPQLVGMPNSAINKGTSA